MGFRIGFKTGSLMLEDRWPQHLLVFIFGFRLGRYGLTGICAEKSWRFSFPARCSCWKFSLQRSLSKLASTPDSNHCRDAGGEVATTSTNHNRKIELTSSIGATTPPTTRTTSHHIITIVIMSPQSPTPSSSTASTSLSLATKVERIHALRCLDSVQCPNRSFDLLLLGSQSDAATLAQASFGNACSVAQSCPGCHGRSWDVLICVGCNDCGSGHWGGGESGES